MSPGCYLLFFEGKSPRLAVTTKIGRSFFEYEWHCDGHRHNGILPIHPSAAYVDLGIWNQNRIFGQLEKIHLSSEKLASELPTILANACATRATSLALENERIAREQAEHARKQAELERRREEQEEHARKQAALDELRRIKFEAFQQVERKLVQDYIGAHADWHEHLSSCLSEDDFNECRSGFVRKWSQRYPDLGLDDEQAAAVAEWGPHIQVTARAGSGKTRTLVARALFHITHCRIAPSSILILAFNKKAVEEIRERLSKHLSEEKMPHVLTFHALAYRIVRPTEDLIFDEGETKESQVFSTTIQRIIDEEMRDGPFESKLRALMEARWKADLERIIALGFNLPQEKFLEHRADLPQTTMNGRRVDTEAHKHIGNALLRLGLGYSYRRGIHRFAGEAYAPDFSHYHKEADLRFLIEVLGEDAAQTNAARQAFWNSDRSANAHLLQLHAEDCQDPDVTLERVARDLASRGFSVSPMNDDELWLMLRDDVIRDFTKAVKGFISRCQKELISPDRLDSMLPDTDPELWSFIQIGKKFIRVPNVRGLQVRFWRLSSGIYRRYRQVLAEEHQTDFDQLMLDAAGLIREGRTGFISARGSGDICQIRHLLIDEFQDFSHLFNELRNAVIAQSPEALFFCVGDDWQAINKFAGSDLRYFTGFQDYFQSSNQKLISRNYRSCRRIVEAGNEVMSGEGPPSIPNSKDSGSVCIVHVEPNLSYTEAEEIVVEELGEQAVPILRIVSDSASRGFEVAVLSRNGSRATPERMLKLEAWERKLRQFLPEEHRKLLKVSTTHGYKGKESDVVILLGPENYPAIHPDAIFNTIFGDTFASNVADEKRLFYVGVTRARSRLFLLHDPESLNDFHNPPATFLRMIQNPTPYDIKSISARLLCGGRVIIRLSNKPGCPMNSGTYLLRDRLKQLGYKWSDENKTWSCFLEPGSINSPFECAQYLQRQPWINETDGVVAGFAWADQSHRLKIDRGTVAADFPASSSPSETQISGGGWRPIPGWTGETTPKPIPAHSAPGSGSEVHRVQVAGVTYENRALAIRGLRVGEVVTLRRQPSNPYDTNAIEVLTIDLRSLGHIPKPLAARLARRFDELGGQLQATVTAMNPGTINGTYLSLSIQFEIPGLDTAQLAVPSPPSASHLPTSADPAARLSPQEILDAVNAELAASVANPTPEDLAPAQSPCLAPSQQNELADLGDERLRRLITDLYLGGSCAWPTFGYEGMDRGGRCTGSMLEIAWPDFKVGIALPTNDVASFVTNGWMICAAATASERILRAFFTGSSETSTSAPQSAIPATVKPTSPLDLDAEFENFRNRYPYGATSIDDDDDIPF